MFVRLRATASLLCTPRNTRIAAIVTALVPQLESTTPLPQDNHSDTTDPNPLHVVWCHFESDTSRVAAAVFPTYCASIGEMDWGWLYGQLKDERLSQRSLSTLLILLYRRWLGSKETVTLATLAMASPLRASSRS